MRNFKEIIKGPIEFMSACADNYRDDKLSRDAARVGLLMSAFLETYGYLYNNPEQVVTYGLLGIIFGTPTLINFIKEIKNRRQIQIHKAHKV
ncbi:MAG: hypothetical protein ACPLRN_02720 [Microgenomates group bacterium]